MGINFSKNKENQALKTYDLLSLFILMFLVLCCVLFVLSRRGDSSRTDRAFLDMKLLSHQILDEKLAESRRASTREPASAVPRARLKAEGRISKDPWGHPYYYKVMRSEAGDRKVVVWSSGPDGVPETRDWDLRLGSGRGSLAINYRGDDLGYFTQ